jgi:hypothetical protein
MAEQGPSSAFPHLEVPIHSELQESLPSSNTSLFVSVSTQVVRKKRLSCSSWSYFATVGSDQSACRDAHLQCRKVVLLSSRSGDEVGEARILEYVPSVLSYCW